MPSAPVAPDLIERLVEHRLLGDAPREELEWLAAHGRSWHLRTGEVAASPAMGEVEELFIILSGRMGMYIERGGVPRKVIEWVAGDVTGLIPYSRLTIPPGTGRADEPTDILSIHRRDLQELTRVCPVVTGKLVQRMLDRARHFQKEALHDARMTSLGRLAAGLAHELDNPASAVIRSAKTLISSLDSADRAARVLGESRITAQQFGALESLRDRCIVNPVTQVRSPIEQARHEEEILDWLEARGLTGAEAEALAETPVTIPMLDELAAALEPPLLEPGLRWVAAGCTIRQLAAELDEGASRISHLVRAVKGFSQLDTAATPEPVDVEPGLTQTLTVLRSKARAKSIRVAVEVEPGLPPVRAVAGELNQVWLNLIDNALDAVGDGGTVEVTARRDGRQVEVQVADDGPGIPAEIQEQIFEPFYTTKDVGQGTGLGLDIVRRLVDRHNGAIELSSAPGRTEFRVRLMVDPDPDRGGEG